MFNYVIFDPATGEITGFGVIDEASFEATKAANPSLGFMIGHATPQTHRVDLTTMKIIPREYGSSQTNN